MNAPPSTGGEILVPITSAGPKFIRLLPAGDILLITFAFAFAQGHFVCCRVDLVKLPTN